MLCEIGRRLREVVRETDVVARIAGDEFAIVCPSLAGPDALGLTAERARAIADLPFPSPVGPVRLSVGAVLALDGEQPSDVLRRADTVMYADKSAHEMRRRVAAPVTTAGALAGHAPGSVASAFNR